MILLYHVTSVLFSEVWCSEGTSFPPQVLACWTRLLLPEAIRNSGVWIVGSVQSGYCLDPNLTQCEVRGASGSMFLHHYEC